MFSITCMLYRMNLLGDCLVTLMKEEELTLSIKIEHSSSLKYHLILVQYLIVLQINFRPFSWEIV